MTKQTEKYGQSFGIAAVSFILLGADGKPGQPAGYSELPGSLEVSGLSKEVVTTVGGFHTYPVYARAGTGSGEAKLMLNECPSWLERIALGGEFATGSTEADADNPTIAAASTALNPGDNTNSVTQITLEKTAGAVEVATGRYWLTAADDRGVDVVAHTARGEFSFSDVNPLDDNAANRALGDLGLSVKAAGQALNPALTQGHTSYVDVIPSHKGRSIVVTAANADHSEYMVKAWTVNRRSPGDNLVEVTLPRVMVHGYSDKSEFNVAPSGVEFSLQLIEPLDGTPIFRKEHIASAK